MSFSDKDYYQILGISPDATSKEIKERYKKLMMENHPDRFKGLKAKYEAEGDEVLLEVLEEKIRQAEEACKFINEAYKVLSDPALRKIYDEETYEPKVPVPEIVISPTEISFGDLNEGQRKSESFTIENKGGPAVAVEINWEDDPDWGELIIEPDPEETFPIKVTIKVDTTEIPSGTKNQKMFIKVNGTSHTVEVSLTVTPAYKPHPATAKAGVVPPPVVAVSHPTARPRRGLISALLIGVVLICGLVALIDSANSAAEVRQREQEQQEQRQFEAEVRALEQSPPIRFEAYLFGELVVLDITNEWESDITLVTRYGDPSPPYCDTFILPNTDVGSGETVLLRCLAGSEAKSASEVCARFVLWGSGSYSKYFLNEPQPTVCTEIEH